MAKRLKLFIPLVLFFVLIGLFVYTLNKKDYNPRDLPSALINQPIPHFNLTTLADAQQNITPESVRGEPFLLNVWATWCVSCRVEHPYFMQLQQQGIKIIGVNYKDDRAKALDWLARLGNPYQQNIFDVDGSLGLDLGVYGAPETYLVDAAGIIRFKHVGIVDDSVWQQDLLPRYQQLINKK